MLIIHLVWFRRSGVWERNIMTAEIIAEVHHLVSRMRLERLAGMMLLSVLVLGLPDNFIMIREGHWFELRFKSKDLFLFLSGRACAVRANSKVLLHLRVDDWEMRRFFRLSISCGVMAME